MTFMNDNNSNKVNGKDFPYYTCFYGMDIPGDADEKKAIETIMPLLESGKYGLLSDNCSEAVTTH